MLTETTIKHLKIARTLIGATLQGNENGTYTRNDNEGMIGGALGDLAVALALTLGNEDEFMSLYTIERAARKTVSDAVANNRKVLVSNDPTEIELNV